MEAMMNDQIFDREYQAGRAALNDGLSRIFASAGKSLQVLHSIHFDAPWKHSAPTIPGRSKAA
jgi:hypothetical protein